MAHSSGRPAAVRSLGDGYVGLWISYDDRHLAKALPARWDKSLKCWRLPIAFRADAERLVERLNAGVDVELIDALIVMFRRLPPALRQPVYRGLSKAVHPDRGGNTSVMQSLTGAWSASEVDR